MHVVKPWLQLMRPANAPTAAADVLAGALLAGAHLDQWPSILSLVGASMCLYTGGMVLNDVCDADRDAVDRPERPIPSGRVARRSAASLAVVLLVAGCVLALTAGRVSGMMALVLVAGIVVYDAIVKQTPLAPAVMGLCRAGNLMLGISWVGAFTQPAHLYAAAVLWLYVASLTFFAAREAVGGSTLRLGVGGAGIIVAIAALFAFPWVLNTVTPWYYALVGVLLGRVFWALVSSLRGRRSAGVQVAVGTMILWLVVLDACMVMAVRGALAGGLVLLLVVPVAVGRRYFKMT